MSERPFMQLYVSDYLGDTRHLSCEQHGAYLLLLMTMWNASGSLPDDDSKLARIVCLSVKKWRLIRDDILRFFEVENGLISHGRLSKELQKSESKSQSRASSGAEGGRAKALKDKEARLANATVLPCHLPDTITIQEKETPSGVSKKRATRLPDDWVIPDPWLQEAIDAGLSRVRALSEAERMKNWSLSNKNGAKLDWLASWRNWYRDKLETPRGGSPPKKLTQAESILQMAREEGIIDATGNPTRRVETRDRHREDSVVGYIGGFAVTRN